MQPYPHRIHSLKQRVCEPVRPHIFSHPERLLMCIAMALVVATTACGGKTVLQPDDSEPQESVSPVDRLEEDLKLADSAARFPNWFVVRYNPPGCDCPPLELKLEDRWVRIHVDWETAADASGTQETLASAASAFAAGSYPRLWLNARLHRRANLCGESTLCARAVGYGLSPVEPTAIESPSESAP